MTSVVEHSGEFVSGVVVFPGGERHRPICGRLGVGSKIVGREGLLEPIDTQLLIGRHDLAHVFKRVACIGVDQDREVIGICGADFGHTGDVVPWIVANTQFDRFKAHLDMRCDLIDQSRRLLPAQRHATCVGLNLLVGTAAKQIMERPSRRLGLDVPEGHVETTHGDGGRSAQAVAAQLPLIDFRPETDDIVSGTRQDDVPQRGVDDPGDDVRRAGMVRLAIAHQARVGRNPDDDRITLYGATDGEGRAVVDAHRNWTSLNLNDLHRNLPPAHCLMQCRWVWNAKVALPIWYCCRQSNADCQGRFPVLR